MGPAGPDAPWPNDDTAWCLVDNGRRDGFAALLLPAPQAGMPLLLSDADAAALGWDGEAPLWAALLDPLHPPVEVDV